MQKAFDLIKERITEKIEITWEHDYLGGKKDAFSEAIEIVNQVAEEYGKDTNVPSNDAWRIIYDKVCDMEKRYAKIDGDMESVNNCIRLENLMMYFREELQNTDNDGWIPCSERLPEETDEDLAGDYLDNLDELIEKDVFKPYLVTIEGAKVPTELYYVGSAGEVLWYDVITEEFYKVTAWQPLPQPYVKGE